MGPLVPCIGQKAADRLQCHPVSLCALLSCGGAFSPLAYSQAAGPLNPNIHTKELSKEGYSKSALEVVDRLVKLSL